MTKNGTNAFVITGDKPVRARTLKRLMLFHPRVYFSDIKDIAIVNENEVTEQFPRMTSFWPAKGHYPRVSEYSEIYARCLTGADAALRRGMLRPIVATDVSIDPGSHWMCHNASLSDPDLVQAASIDATPEPPEIKLESTILSGLSVTPRGVKSKYDVEYKDPFDVDNVHSSWNAIAHLRVGRAIKSIRLAQALGASPLAVDHINTHIALAFSRQNYTYKIPEAALMDFAINTQVVDNEKLEAALADATWDEVLGLRREILPHVMLAKEYLVTEKNKLSQTQRLGLEDHLRLVADLRTGLATLQEKEAEAWEKLRIGSITKFSGPLAVASMAAPFALPTMTTLPSMIAQLVTLGLVGASSLTSELKELLPARRKLREHPLFFMEKLDL